MSTRSDRPQTQIASDLAPTLQLLLVASLHLALQVKQAHWNVYGAGFRDLHRHLDDIAELLQDAADELAERAVILGSSPDGRLQSLVKTTPLADLADGPLLVDQATAFVAAQLVRVVELARERMDLLDSSDPVSMDLVVDIVGRLEKHRWMLMADFSSAPPAQPAG